MVTVSPPVSPSVVAAILITQKVNVTSGTLLGWDWAATIMGTSGLGTPPPNLRPNVLVQMAEGRRRLRKRQPPKGRARDRPSVVLRPPLGLARSLQLAS